MLRGPTTLCVCLDVMRPLENAPPPCPGAFLVSLRPEGTITHIYAAPGRLQFLDYVTESLRPEKQRGSVFLCSDRTILLKFTGYIEK